MNVRPAISLESNRHYLVAHLPSDDQETDHVLLGVRALSDEELAAFLGANKLVQQLTMSNPYFSLERAHERWAHLFRSCLQILERHEEGTLEAERMLHHDLSSSVSAVLSEFRAFVDHTDRWARDALGEAASGHIKDQTRTEYDRSFEYRLAYNLRNTAQHRKPVVRLEWSGTEVAPGASVCELSVTVPTDAVDDQWQARVRKEFASLNEPVDVTHLLRELMRSCERIVCRLFVVAEPKVEVATRLVLEARDEVRAATHDSDAVASVMIGDLQQGPGGGFKGDMQLTNLRSDRAESLLHWTALAPSLLA